MGVSGISAASVADKFLRMSKFVKYIFFTLTLSLHYGLDCGSYVDVSLGFLSLIKTNEQTHLIGSMVPTI